MIQLSDWLLCSNHLPHLMKDNVVAKTGNKEGLCEDPQTQTTEDVLWSELLLSEFPEVVKSNQYKENYN